jgi:hypothetical protein
MQDTLVDIVKHHKHFEELKADSQGNPAVATNGRVYRGLDQIASQLKQVRAFLQELETKLQNILALVSPLVVGFSVLLAIQLKTFVLRAAIHGLIAEVFS